MQSFSAGLQSDLRVLSNEARKKHTAIKDSAERAVVALRGVSHETDAEGHASAELRAVCQSEAVMTPLLQSLALDNSPKLAMCALTALQKLFSSRVVEVDALARVIQGLKRLLDMDDDNLMLRVLQTILIVLQPSGVLIPEDALAEAVDICFKLHEHKAPVVHNTAAATLRQAINLLFDRVDREYEGDAGASAKAVNVSRLQSADVTSSATSSPSKGDAPLPPDNPSAQGAYLLFQDLCVLSHGDSGSWLRIKSMSRTLGLELIESVLSQHVGLFVNHKEFAFLLKERVCSLVIKTLRSMTDFPLVVRLMRMIATLVRHYGEQLATECEIFLSMLVKMLDPEYRLWHRTLTLEVLRLICGEPRLLRFLFVSYDLHPESTKVFKEMVNGLGKFVQSMFDGDDSRLLVISGSSSFKPKGLELLGETDPPVFGEEYAVSVSIECMLGVVDGLASLCGVAGSKVEIISRKSLKPRGEPRSYTNLTDEEVAQQMTDEAWPPVLASLSLLLNNCTSEALLQVVLRAYQSFTNSCGGLGLVTPRDAFLTSLCKNSMPPWYERERGSAVSTTGEVQGSVSSTVDANGNRRLLSPKNIQSLKALFNIAHCLGGILDTAWLMVLETLDSLDRVVKRTSDSSSALPNEIVILQHALTGLFEATKKLDEKALVHLFGALCSVSINSINAETGVGESQEGIPSSGKNPPRMFGLQKIVDSTTHNMHRIHKVWPHITGHLNQLANHKAVYVREKGVEAFTTMITAALSREHDESTDGDDHTQKLLLEPLDELYCSSYDDTRAAMLNAIFNILNSCGHSLHEGWPIVLQILKAVAIEQEASLIPVGFRSIDLIGNDFLSNLPVDCINMFVTTIGCYGQQRADVNISLTAVGLLWNVADHLQKVNAAATGARVARDSHSEVSEHEEDLSLRKVPTMLDGGNTQDMKNQIIELWLVLYQEMGRLSVDGRPEVRNSALRTLMSTVCTHGHLLEKPVWNTVLHQVLFVLLSEVENKAAASEGESVGTELGKENGKSVMMLVHHSRNTSAKQWDETRVLALNGVARVFRTFFGILSQLDSFDAAWDRLMLFIKGSVLSGSREVVLASIQSLQETMMSNTSDENKDYFTREMWEKGLDVFATIVGTVTEKNVDSPQRTCVALLDSFGALYQKSKETFSDGDIRRMLMLTHKVCIVSMDGTPYTSSAQTICGAALNLMSLIEPAPNTAPIIVHILCEYLATLPFGLAEISSEYPIDFISSGVVMPKNSGSAVAVAFAERALELLENIYKQYCPPDVRIDILSDCLKVLGPIMLTKTAEISDTLWKQAGDAFLEVIKLGLAAMKERKVTGLDEKKSNEIWTVTAMLLQKFLLASPSASDAPLGSGGEDEFDMALCGFIGQDVLSCGLVPSDIQPKFVELLRGGATLRTSDNTMVQASRDGFSRSSVKNLFQLVSVDMVPDESRREQHLLVARQTLPELLSYCRDVLNTLIEHEKVSGQRPLPRNKQTEVMNVLEQLRSLNVEPEIFDRYPTVSSLKGGGGAKGHLFALYPELAQCITTREDEIKVVLKGIFMDMGDVIGLGSSPDDPADE